jgi:PAS domain S-box-containing protein
MLCAWHGGFGPGVLATVVSLLGADFFLMAPQFAFGPKSAADWAGMGMFLMLGIALSYLVESIHGAKRKVESYAQEIAHQREWLRVTLTSIGDAVIATDTAGRVTFLNRVAQSLTGWKPDAALGQPMDKVFAIVNEHSRKPVANPVSRVLREKVVVGLSNHTVLIGQDGKEIPIDDSAAPIESEQGSILGAVLVFRDITERRQAEQALKDADRRKDEFLAVLAHELRNPLAPIRNAVQIMKVRGLADAELRGARDVVERQVQQMARLVDDLLDVSRIGRGKITLRTEVVDLGAIVNRAVETVRPLINEQKHELLVTLAPEPVLLEADPTRLEQILANLLNNAAKYTDRGGHINLTVRRQANDVEVQVRDTGIGISADMLPRIFDMFVQADQRSNRAKGGLGIGLTLVRRLVEMHGGSIMAHSAGSGQGSEFVVRLPLASIPQRGINAEAPRCSCSSASVRRRVLVVDDNKDAAETLAAVLRLRGHEVQVAFDGVTALAAAQASRPDFILLDLGMPGMDGYEVAQHLREQPARRQTVLVALTGWGQEEDRRRSQEAGFDFHMVKPVEPDMVDALLGGTSRSDAAECLHPVALNQS